VIVALSIAPSGPPLTTTTDAVRRDTGDDGAGVADAVAAAVQVLRASGLPCETNAMFTNVEGEWDEVMSAVHGAVEAVSQRYPRVSLVLKADIRGGYSGEMHGKVDRLETALDQLASSTADS
jgi:uncharacterized protein YqgV (UPF0045/DUF77 family)